MTEFSKCTSVRCWNDTYVGLEDLFLLLLNKLIFCILSELRVREASNVPGKRKGHISTMFHYAEHLVGVREAAARAANAATVRSRCTGLRSASLPCATMRLLPHPGQALTPMATS